MCAPHAVHHGHSVHCVWKPLPDRVKRYILGMVAAKEKPTSTGVQFAGRKNPDMTRVVTGSEEHWTASMDYLGALWNIWGVCGTLEVLYGWYRVCMEHHGSPGDI